MSYSYLHTVLDTPFEFWNFPAYAGINYDGAATNIVWQPNQQFVDPGIPAHLFNVLANYKFKYGLGFQGNIQVTGPVQTSQAGYIDIAATEAALTGQGMALPPYLMNSANGYYNPPTIPWQFTVNAAVFYNFLDHYTVKFEIYNLTDEKNVLNDQGFYGNDFLTRLPTRSFDLTFTAKL
jgi:outer membrane receptor protein involved in Fe transport